MKQGFKLLLATAVLAVTVLVLVLTDPTTSKPETVNDFVFHYSC